jgi:membrane dipeptidase
MFETPYIIDLHVDSIIQQRLFGYDVTRRHRSLRLGQPLFWHCDIPRMCEAGYKGACLGIHYWPWESEGGWRELNRQIDYLDRVLSRDESVLRVRGSGDWERAAGQNKLALGPGVEGAHMLNGDLSRVQGLRELGVQYLTLTHFSKNKAATPSMGRGANERDGLSAFGRELVTALNEAEIVVDLAHVNMPGVLDACALSREPVFVTHTGAKACYDHARCLSDEAIDAVVETDGVIGIIFAPIFLTGRRKASTECVLDHLEYVIDRAGIRHVAIGSDYDGWLPAIPDDQRDCLDIALVPQGLSARGYSSDDIRRIMGTNALEVLDGTRRRRRTVII